MFILLLLFWIALNGKITLEILIIGLIATTFIYSLMIKLFGCTLKNNLKLLKNSVLIVEYLFILLYEIFKSSIAVTKLTFKSKIEVQPQIVFLDVPLKSEFLITVLANSITLTPGTITVDVDENHFCVHALDYTLAEGMEDIIFLKMLLKMEANNGKTV